MRIEDFVDKALESIDVVTARGIQFRMWCMSRIVLVTALAQVSRQRVIPDLGVPGLKRSD